MEGVGEFQHQDLLASIDRNSDYYREAIGWARHVLLARGRTLGHAGSDVWTFLIRTPEPVEAGIRGVLQQGFGAGVIAKRGKKLEGSHLTMTPDLITADDSAVADVKYKLTAREWSRPDLYQLVAFGTAFRSRHAALIDFSPPGTRQLPALGVGEIKLRHLAWPADPGLTAESALEEFGLRARAWLESTGATPKGTGSLGGRGVPVVLTSRPQQ
jgi:hypothetical protein